MFICCGENYDSSKTKTSPKYQILRRFTDTDPSCCYHSNSSSRRYPRAVCNPNATTIKEAVCLEDLNWHVEHTMAFDVVYKLIDPRDGEEYSVGRLRDERVWLLDNLRLGGEEEIVLNSETSNIPEGTTFTLPSSDTWENTYEEPYIGTSDKYTVTAANEDWKSLQLLRRLGRDRLRSKWRGYRRRSV